MGQDDVIHFHDSHRPALPDGDYRVSVSQTLNDGLGEHRFEPLAPSAFTVAGPRFQLEPSAIHSVFPPPLADGDFEGCLPHVLLTRPTLPWERSADPRAPDDKAPPWLALLLLDEDELADCTLRIVTVGEMLNGPDAKRPEAAQWPKLGRETSDVASDPVRVIELPLGALAHAGLNLDHLDWLAHVRVLGPQDEQSPRAIETAAVVSARIVRRGRHYEAHLVSLEGWCAGGQAWLPASAKASTTVRLVSLHHWRFECISGVSLRDELRALNAARLASGRPATPDAAHYLERGWVPLRHEFRNGDRAVSWYRSPLTPGGGPDSSDLALWLAQLPLCADELRLYEPESAMFDMSHAAAWELGRLLALQNPRIGLRLHHWKREHARFDRRRAAQAEHSDLVHAPHPAVEPVLDESIQHWFVTDLYRLEAVPYRYLIPDDDMLPKEALRFFSVDPVWLHCLADGAFSVGRTSADEARRDAALAGALPPPPALFGFVLRSRLLVDYPGLMLDASDDRGDSVPPLRIAHLAPGVLIALYATPIRQLALHLHPQALHFELREPWPRNDPQACLNLSALKAQHGVTHSGDIALRLLARNPRVTFLLEGQ